MTNRRELVVVTGGTKGIGRAIVEKFAANGFDVAVYARSLPGLDELRSYLESTYGIRCHTMAVNAANRSEVEEFARLVMGIDSELKVLVNNAGTFVPGTVLSEEEGAVEKMMETNLYSAYFLSRILAPKMKDMGSGHIFNICSIASITAYINGGSYCISKYAMLGFSRVLREELKESGVRVTAVLPGATYTGSWEGSGLPEDRFVRAGDVADAIYSSYSLSPSAVVEELIIRPQLGDI